MSVSLLATITWSKPTPNDSAAIWAREVSLPEMVGFEKEEGFNFS